VERSGFAPGLRQLPSSPFQRRGMSHHISLEHPGFTPPSALTPTTTEELVLTASVRNGARQPIAFWRTRAFPNLNP
jgi:hypothetical protein